MLDRGFRERPEKQSVPGLEPDVLGELLSAGGAGGGDTETAWRRHQGFRGADRGRPGCSDGGGAETGVAGRVDLSSGLVWLSSGTGAGERGRGLQAAVLETG